VKFTPLPTPFPTYMDDDQLLEMAMEVLHAVFEDRANPQDETVLLRYRQIDTHLRERIAGGADYRLTKRQIEWYVPPQKEPKK
jgi:hypothetical protein